MYEYNGRPITLEQIQSAAQKSNLSVEEYIAKAGIITKSEEPGKKTSQGQGAPVAEIAAPEIQIKSTESTPEDGSLELQEISLQEKKKLPYNIAQKLISEKNFTRKRVNEVIEESKKSTMAGSLVDAAKSVPLELAKGIGGVEKMIKYGLINAATAASDLTKEEKNLLFESFTIPNTAISMQSLNPKIETALNDLEENRVKIESDSFAKAFEKGKYKEAAFLLTEGLIKSSPSIAAAFLGPAGMVAYGSTVTGNKFNEEYNKNKEEGSLNLLGNALATGALQVGSDYVFGKILKTAGVIKSKGDAKQAVEFLKDGFLDISKRLSFASLGEGATEVIQEISQKALDATTLERGVDLSNLKYELIDNFVLGAVMGGGITAISNISQSSEAKKSYAQHLLMPEILKKDIKNKAAEINKIAEAINTTEDPDIQDVYFKKIEEIENSIIQDKGDYLTSLNSMNNAEIINYASNKDAILKAKNNIKSNPQNADLLNKEIESLENQNKDILDIASERKLEENILTTQKLSEKSGIETKVFNNKSESLEFLNNLKGKEGKEALTVFSLPDGFIVQNKKSGKQSIYIDKETANEAKSVTVGSHELLHGILFNTVKNSPTNAVNLGQSLFNELAKIDIDKIADSDFLRRLKLYNSSPKETAAEEVLTLFSDALSRGHLSYNENIFRRIGDNIRRILQNFGFKQIKFDSGKDVYNFIKDYNKSFESGAFKGAIERGRTEGFKGKLIIEENIKDSIDNAIKESESNEASKRVQQIYDQQGKAGAGKIAEQYKSMAGKIAAVYRDRPGFETYKEDLIDGILNDPTYGVLGLTLNYKPEENKGVPLAAYINKYLRARSITLANQLLGKDEASVFKSDVTEAKDIMATETAEDAINVSEEIAKEKPKAKKQKLSEKIIFTKELGDIVKNQMIKSIALNIKKFDLETTKNRTITPFIADYKKDISDFLEKDIVKFIKESGVEKFLIENREIILDNFTTTFLSKHPFFRKGILKRVNGEWVAPTKIGPYKYDWVDEKDNKLKIDRDNAAGRGMTSGPEFIKRNPKIKEIIKENEFVDYHFQDGALRNKIKVNPINSIARQIAAEQSFEILKEDLINNGELTQTIKERAGLAEIILGEDAIDNLAKDIDRGIIKFSLSSNSLKNIVKNSANIIEEFQGKSNSDTKTMAGILKKYTVKETAENINSAAEYIVEALNKIFKPLITSNTPKNKAIEIIQSDLFNNLTISGGVVTLVGNKYNKLLIKGELTEQGEKLNKFYIDSWKNKLLKIKDPKDQAEELYKLIAFTSRTLRNDKFLKNNKQINDLLLSEIFKNPKLKHLKNKIKLTKTNQFRRPGIIGPKGRIGIPTEYNISEKSSQYKINEKYVQGYNYFSDEASRMLLKDYREIKSTSDINLFKNWASIQSQSRSLLRLAARLTHVEDNLNTKSKETVWEHMTPASEIMRLFAANFISENLVSEQELINELKDYSVALVNESTDNTLTEKGFKEITKRKNLLEKPITRYKKALSNENFNKIKEIAVKEQEDRLLYSKSMNTTFNEMIERKKGFLSTETVSQATAKLTGAKKGKFKVFIPPSADDFAGLLYNFLGTGKQGDADMKFFEDKLLKPLARANSKLNSERQAIKQGYHNLVKANKGISKKLRAESDYKYYSNDAAVRVYMWNKLGYEVPGISETDKIALIKSVKSNPALLKFADELITVPNKTESWLQPEEDWTANTVESDLQDILSKIGRARIFEEFITNADIVFSKENINKVEAAYGPDLRSALDDMLYRIKKGRAREVGGNKMANAYLNWVRGSVATTMFFNTRSALLQQLSIVNFTNWEDNNVFAQGKFIAGNPKEYAKYWVEIFNSDWMKERRQGLKTDINESELVAKLEGSKNKNKALLSYILEKGFSLTKYGDNIAIATGGAPFLYNREQKYIKEGMTESKAKEEAFLDFQEIAERTQQSSRQDLLSNQQVSVIGRIFLAFQNTTMQMTRLQKKAALDIINRRGSFKANISRLVYYGAIQNTLFSYLQSALFVSLFGDDEDEELKIDDKTVRAINTVLDSALRGSGIAGAALATLKNAIITWKKEDDKGFRGDNSKVILELLNISPAVGIKARKINTAMNAYKFNKKILDDISYTNPNNPYYGIAGALTSAAINVPLDRIVSKAANLQAITQQDAEAWQRTALFLGYNTWDVGLKDPEIEAAKNKSKNKSSGRGLKKKGFGSGLKKKRL